MSITDSENIRQTVERYKCKLDPLNDTLENMKTQIDEFLSFLDTKRYNTITLAKSIYTLRLQAERIPRYKEWSKYKNLTDADCNELLQYVHKSIIKFLEKPVEGANIYLYSALTNCWVIISPAGYLWLIYGDAIKQIHLVGKYLSKIIDENPNLLELKQAKDFVDKFTALLSFTENKFLLSMLIDDENFMQAYEYIHSTINKESARNKMA